MACSRCGAKKATVLSTNRPGSNFHPSTNSGQTLSNAGTPNTANSVKDAIAGLKYVPNTGK